MKFHYSNNQNFCTIPHYILIKQLEYKLSTIGVKVILQEESYTSKSSFLDLDEIPVYGEKHDLVFSGRRIKRGLYKSFEGILVNADMNGSGNILRKAFPNQMEWDRGIVDMPVVLKKL